MPGINIVTKSGPKTFKAETAVVGGQIVEAGVAGVVPASADSESVLGVALADAGPQVAPEEGVLVRQKPEHVAVAYGGHEVYLETVSQLSLGDKVGTDAAGKAKVWTAGDVVGVVTDPAPTENRALVRLS